MRVLLLLCLNECRQEEFAEHARNGAHQLDRISRMGPGENPNDKIAGLIQETLRKWDMAGV